MPRVKRGLAHLKKRHNLHKLVKGFEGGRKNLIKLAKTASLKAGSYAYKDRKLKKRNARKLWNVRINAAAKATGSTYSRLIGGMKKNLIGLDRKVLSAVAKDYPEVFKKIVEKAS